MEAVTFLVFSVLVLASGAAIHRTVLACRRRPARFASLLGLAALAVSTLCFVSADAIGYPHSMDPSDIPRLAATGTLLIVGVAHLAIGSILILVAARRSRPVRRPAPSGTELDREVPDVDRGGVVGDPLLPRETPSPPLR